MPGLLRSLLVGCLMTSVVASSSAQDVRLRPRTSVYVDAKGEPIKRPEAVAYDGESLLVIADTGNRRLVVCDVTEDRVTATGEIRLAQLPYPIQVRLDSQSGILALDGRSQRIVRTDVNGEFKGYVEISASTARSDVTTRSFDLDRDDNLHILDVSGGRILVVDSSGTLLRQIAFPPEVGFLSDLTVNSAGIVFAIDSVAGRVFLARKADEALSPLTEAIEGALTFPTSIAADGKGLLFISDQHGGNIVVLGQNGEFRGRQSAPGWKEGFLRYPAGLATAAGRLLVADRENNRIQIFTVVR